MQSQVSLPRYGMLKALDHTVDLAHSIALSERAQPPAASSSTFAPTLFFAVLQDISI
jgi:hypothetical protein